MPGKAASARVVVFALMFAYAGGVLAQDTTVIPNTTNDCINSTYKFWSPNMTNPTLILIDRRVTFDPVALCTTAATNSAGCNRDMGTPMLLVASALSTAFSMQIAMNPYCSWNCGTCGMIRTDGPNSGLPIELMDFSVEDDFGAVGGEESSKEPGER